MTEVIGTRCLNTSYAELVTQVQEWSEKKGVTAVDFTNVHIVAMRRVDAQFAKWMKAFDYFVPDSQVLYFTIKALGGSMTERVYGPTFWHHGVAGSPRPIRHYFLGGSEECVEKLVGRAREICENVEIAGYRNGYFSEEDEATIVDEINALSPDFIWIGLGTPKQQEWIFRNKPKLKRGVLLAVGFAFDVNAGTKNDAPKFLQRAGLTWLFRLCAEPGRLWKRYLKYNSLYLYFLAKQIVLRERFDYDC